MCLALWRTQCHGLVLTILIHGTNSMAAHHLFRDIVLAYVFMIIGNAHAHFLVFLLGLEECCDERRSRCDVFLKDLGVLDISFPFGCSNLNFFTFEHNIK